MHKGQLLMMAGALALASGSWGCSDASGEGSDETLGSVEMRLQSTAPSGITYRLRNALFNVVDGGGTVAGVLNSDTDPTATLLTGTFQPGFYDVTLQDGWFLERTDMPGGMVMAQLSSPATQSVNIQTGVTSTLKYTFRAADESIVFAGTLAIDLDVCGEDGFEPNDTPGQATFLPFNQVRQAGICGNVDYFQFNNPIIAGVVDFVQIDFQSSVGDLDLRLTKPDGSSIGSFFGIDQERIEFPADQAGQFLVLVDGFSGAVGNYSIIHGQASP